MAGGQGNQIITFRYQQEGTARGFNRLNCKLCPAGLISGGEITQSSGNLFNIAPMVLAMCDLNSDPSNPVFVNVETTESFSLTVNDSSPYIVATFSWQELANNYVNFTTMSHNDIVNLNSKSIIIGRCEFDSGSFKAIDTTRTNYRFNVYENEFRITDLKTEPPFRIKCPDTYGKTLYVGKGKCILNGQEISFNGDTLITLNTDGNPSYLYYNSNGGLHGRTDLIVLDTNVLNYVRYICANDGEVAKCPSNMLPIAKVKFQAGDSYSNIYGDMIEYIYNNHYYKGQASLGIMGYEDGQLKVINPHTLYL